MNPTPERQLEIAKECGATENELSADGAWNVCFAEQAFKAYTSRVIAEATAEENYELKQAIQVQAMQLNELQAKLTKAEQNVKVLVETISKTVEENGYLADGDNCTLIHLVRALATVRKEG